MKTASTSPGRSRGRWIRLGKTVVFVSGLMLLGALYESMAEASDARVYPPPGKLVDVGGYRLHINCAGTGAPTVVIDAGLGDWSTMWAWVQPEVAKTTRVCTYDRAGNGWSEAGPLPRNAVQYAVELHTLLHESKIPVPYVLVGHSLGGFSVRVFTDMYPSEVAGVVLIDSMSPRQFPQSSAGTIPQMDSQSPPELRKSYTILPALARVGFVRLLVRPLGLIPHLPPQVENAYLSRMVRPSNLQAYLGDESRGMPESARQVEVVKTFGDLPLIVLTARQNNIPGWQEWQAELLQLSSNSQQLFAESGHNIEIEQPEAAIAAIVKMVERVRQPVQN
jgi:pimeloyl-ACP methyl ester carboxylesterase